MFVIRSSKDITYSVGFGQLSELKCCESVWTELRPVCLNCACAGLSGQCFISLSEHCFCQSVWTVLLHACLNSASVSLSERWFCLNSDNCLIEHCRYLFYVNNALFRLSEWLVYVWGRAQQLTWAWGRCPSPRPACRCRCSGSAAAASPGPVIFAI